MTEITPRVRVGSGPHGTPKAHVSPSESRARIAVAGGTASAPAARGDIMDSYTTLPWANVCAEVAKPRVQLVEGKVVALPRLAVVGGEAEGTTRE